MRRPTAAQLLAEAADDQHEHIEQRAIRVRLQARAFLRAFEPEEPEMAPGVNAMKEEEGARELAAPAVVANTAVDILTQLSGSRR